MKRANIKAIVARLGGARALADRLGISVVAVHAWVRCNSMPLDRACTLAGELGLDRDLLHDPWRGREPEALTREETEALFNGVDAR